MRTPEHSERPQFWSDVYRGRRIAVLDHYRRFHVYLDDVLQHHVLFASHEDAVAWLIQRVNRSAPARTA